LPYINGVKHLGNLVGSMLPADVYARFQRQRLGPENVLFICATDEHGTPAELAALEEGKSVQDYCDHWHAEQKRLYEAFHLSFDYFGRSSSAQNRALTQDFAKTLWEMGFIEERVTKQIYSRAEDRFLPDRYVIGTCIAAMSRRAGINARTAPACSIRPISSIRARLSAARRKSKSAIRSISS
jgi:methionyl-tRNA synthetase